MDKCFECGANNNLYDHHVVPRSKGGTKTIKLCGKCHALIHGVKTIQHKQLILDDKEYKRKNNIYAGGTIPFGYKLEGNKLVRDVTHTKIKRRMTRMLNDKKSYRKIAQEIEKTFNYKISHSGVRKILLGKRKFS